MSKKCPKCSAENRDQAKHCSACGNPLTPSDSGVRYCPSGRHPMDPGWESCPYCSSELPTENGAKTTAEDSVTPPPPPNLPPPPGGPPSRKKTVIDPMAGQWSAPAEPAMGTVAEQAKSSRKKTVFAGPQDEPSGRGVPQPGGRRIVGVFVTYTWKPEGQLFPVRQGRNFIGSDPECEVCLDLDPQMSSQHATVIYRGKDFWIDDEKSMNGTYVNGESVEERQRLPDSSRIQTGATVWKFVSLEPAP